MAEVELRCGRRLHGKLIGTALEIKCGVCSRANGDQPVYHRWRIHMCIINMAPQLMAEPVDEDTWQCERRSNPRLLPLIGVDPAA